MVKKILYNSGFLVSLIIESKPYQLSIKSQLPTKLYQTKYFVLILKSTLFYLRNINGEFFAIDDACTDEDEFIYKGALKGNCVESPLHGSMFDFRSGKPDGDPATEAVTTYPVEVKGNEIYITLKEKIFINRVL